MGIIIVREGTEVPTERFGQYAGNLKPGFHVYNPLTTALVPVNWHFQGVAPGALDRVHDYRIPTCTLQYDPVAIVCETSTHIQVNVDVSFEFTITDVQKATYANTDVFRVVQTELDAALRNAVKQLTHENLDTAQIHRAIDIDKISNGLKSYGIAVKNITVQEYTLPPEIRKATVTSFAKKRARDAEVEELESHKRMRMSKMELEDKEAEMQRAREAKRAQHEADMKQKAVEAEAAQIKTLAEARTEADRLSHVEEERHLQAKFAIFGKDPELGRQWMISQAYGSLRADHMVVLSGPSGPNTGENAVLTLAAASAAMGSGARK